MCVVMYNIVPYHVVLSNQRPLPPRTRSASLVFSFSDKPHSHYAQSPSPLTNMPKKKREGKAQAKPSPLPFPPSPPPHKSPRPPTPPGRPRRRSTVQQHPQCAPPLSLPLSSEAAVEKLSLRASYFQAFHRTDFQPYD